MARITVLGSGSWGCTLGLVADRARHQVCVWGADAVQIAQLCKNRHLDQFLPGVKFPETIQFTTDLAAALYQTDLILVVVPSHAVRAVARLLAALTFGQPIVVNAAKGIENDSLMRMSEVLTAELPAEHHAKICTLSGPSLAREVCAEMPTTVTVAGKNPCALATAQNLLKSRYFRIYTNDDIIGVELAGSLKNVIAIAAGTLDGLGFGDNTKGALITRGLAEITRLGVAMGANPVTFAGLAGMGDLITTCESRQSRNRSVGEQLARGRKLKDILTEMVMVAEGVKTTQAARALSRKTGVEMPIVDAVYAVLFEDKHPLQVTGELMGRQARPEIW